METIQTLETTLEAAKKKKTAMAALAPRINTGFIFDLTNPTIDNFFLLGVAIKTASEYGLPDWEVKDFIAEATKDAYMQVPSVCQKWFGFIL